MYVCKAKTDICQFFSVFYAPFPKTKTLILLVFLSYFARIFAVFCSHFCWRSARISLVFSKKMSLFEELGTLHIWILKYYFWSLISTRSTRPNSGHGLSKRAFFCNLPSQPFSCITYWFGVHQFWRFWQYCILYMAVLYMYL